MTVYNKNEKDLSDFSYVDGEEIIEDIKTSKEEIAINGIISTCEEADKDSALCIALMVGYDIKPIDFIWFHTFYSNGYYNSPERPLYINQRLHNVSWDKPLKSNPLWFLSYHQYEKLAEAKHD